MARAGAILAASSLDISLTSRPNLACMLSHASRLHLTCSVCLYGGIVRNAMSALLPPHRLLENPGGFSEVQSHEWAAAQLRAGACAAYVQPKDKAENMLAQFSAAGGCDLRLIQPSSSEALGLNSYGGGFSTILPFAREKEARDTLGDPMANVGGGACSDLVSLAFTRALQKMHH